MELDKYNNCFKEKEFNNILGNIDYFLNNLEEIY